MSQKDSYYDVKFKDDPGKYFKVSLKYIGVSFNGNGKNMSMFLRCCDLFDSGKIKQLQKLNENLPNSLKNSNSKKKLMLMIFSKFLIDVYNVDDKLKINELFEKSIKYIDPQIHIGQKIYDKMINIKEKIIV
jgi:hypothetical protein